MAVFQQNLGMSTIQFKQLQALESLQDSLEDIFNIDKGIYGRFDEVNKMIDKAARIVATAILKPETNPETIDLYDRVISEANNISRSIESAAERVSESVQEVAESLENPPKPPPGFFEEITDALGDFLKDHWSAIEESTNTWTRMYNDTIKYIGTDKNESQQFRRDIVNIVDSLNADVSKIGDLGAKLDPQKVMDTMISISNSTDISDPETLKALTRPIMLAQETTNLNTAELAKIGNRFYNLYNFNSEDLEEMVGNVRNLAEGRNISEDEIMQLASQNLVYFKEMGFENLPEIMSNISTEIAYRSGNNLDASSYATALELAAQYAAAPDHNHDAYQKLFSMFGNNFEGYMDEFIASVAAGGKGSAAIFTEYEAALADNSYYRNKAGIDYSDSLHAEYVLSGEHETLEELYDSVENGSPATDRLEDTFVSVGDQINNTLNGLSSYLSSIQEDLGIGITDIALLLSTIGNVKSLLGDKGILGVLGGATAGSGGASILASLGKAGAIGLAVAGVAAVATSIYDTYKDVNADKIAAAGDLSKGAAEGTEFIRTSSLDSEGKVTWGYKGVDTTNFTPEELAKFQEEKLLREKEYEDYINSGANLKWYQKAWDIFSDFSGDGTGLVKGTQLEQQKLSEQIASYLENDKYRDMMNQYVGRLDFSKNSMLEGFIQHIDEYLAYYNEGKVAEVKKNGSPGAVADMVASYDVGTNYVEKDQLAYIHQGEEIVPKKYNPAANMDELRAMIEAHDNSQELSEIVDVLSEIKDYMEFWKRDSEKKSAIQSAKSTSLSSLRLKSYYTSSGATPTYV